MADATLAPPVAPVHRLDRSVLLVLANVAVTGILGSLFWLAAPRAVDEETVAASVAAASLLILLGIPAQLNLATALSRFLPGAGARQRSLVTAAYGWAVLAGGVIGGLVVAVGLARGGSVVSGGDLTLTLAVAVALPVWTVFALQDAVLVASRRTSWLPIENGVTSLAKLALLPAAAAVSWKAGVVAAWTLPIVPAVIVVNRLLYSRVLAPGRERHDAFGSVLRYGIGDLPGVLLTIASLRLVPLVVVEVVDSTTAAHVAVPWSILTVSALALPAVSRLALSEMSHAVDDSQRLLRDLTRLTLSFLVPLAVVAAVVSPWLLGIAGEGYADDGSLVLVLGVLGLVPAALVEMRLAALRFAGRMAAASSVQTIRAVLILGGAVGVTLGGHVAWIGGVFAMGNMLSLGVATAYRDTSAIRSESTRGLARPGRMLLDLARFVPGVAGVVLVATSVDDVDMSGLGDLGLVEVLPAAWFLGVALVIVGFVACLGDRRWVRRAAVAHLGALIVVLHGLPGIVEPHPRFPVAWLHVGFIDRIASNGDLLPLLDARFSWAGFFSGGAFVQQLAGEESVLWLVRFAPVAVNAVAALGVVTIGRLSGASRRQALAGAGIFVVANWIGQDYFAPQAMGFVMHLAIVALVLAAFPSDPGRVLPARVAVLLRPERVRRLPVERRRMVASHVALLVVAAAMVVSHQLTPVILALSLFLLALVGRSSARALPFAVAAMFVGWLALSAEAYWIGHLDTILGSVGKVSSLLDQNISERASSTSPDRALVLRSRLVFAVLVWAAAAVSALALRRRSGLPLALVCLAAAPFPLLALQPYGGEMILRVALFSLPGAALLVARSALPPHGAAIGRRVILGLVLVALVPLFVLARFGNERFEYVSENDARLARDVAALVPPGAHVYVRNRQSLVNADRVGDVRYREFRNLPADRVIAELSADDNPVFVMLSESQAAYGEVSEGRADGWLQEVEDGLVATGRLTEVVRHGDAVLYRLVPSTGEEQS